MQFPPSTDQNMYEISRAYKDEYALQQFLEKYQPDWVLLPVNHQPSSKNIEQYDQYVPVYSGDSLVAYVNKTTNSELANEHELKYMDAHKLSIKDNEEKENYVAELEKLLSIHPDSIRIIQTLASYYREKKDHEKARKYATRFTELDSNNPNSHYLLGITLRDLELYTEAIPVLKKALKHTLHNQKFIIEQAIASTYYFDNQFSDAYRLFKKSLNPYLNNVSADAMYMYALSATIHGDLKGASKLLDMILFSTNPEAHEDIVFQSKDLKRKILNGEFDTPSFLAWAIEKITG